jgi:hypothetical protein
MWNAYHIRKEEAGKHRQVEPITLDEAAVRRCRTDKEEV